MASAFVQTNGRVIAGEGDPTGGDALVTNLSLFPENSLYINNNTGKLWVRNAEAGVVGDWVGASGGSGDSLFPTTGTGTATGNVTGDLGTFSLSISGGGNNQLTIDPTAGTEGTDLRAHNNTGSGNFGSIDFATLNTQAEFSVNASFDGGADLATIVGHAESGVSSIVHTADTHTFNAGGLEYLTLNGVTFESQLIANDNTGNALVRLTADQGGGNVNFNIAADDDTKEVSILGDAIANKITYDALHHIFLQAQNFATNAAAVIGGVPVGGLYYTDTAGQAVVKIVI